MAEISVPVKLQIQNLQSLVNELQSKLGNLKVGSTGFKAIQNTIASIRGEIDKLSIQTAKPFIDASQFTKAERAVENLEDDIEKVGLVMSRLKFSDLELTSEQKADIKAFEDQLTSIKDKLKVVKNTAKDEFLNSALGQEWLKIDETAFSKTLSQITNNIRSAVADQNTELKKLEETAQSYQRALTENARIKEFISKNNGDPLSQANLGDLYDKIFTTTAKGQFRYTNNGRNLLKDWLEGQLHLDDSTINQIISKNVSAANVGEKLKEVLNNQVQQNQRVVDNNPNVTAQVDAAKAKYDELIAILRQVGLSEDQVAATETTLRNAFSQTTGEFNNYKEKLLAIAQGHANIQGTTNAMRSQLESLRTTLESTNGEFIRMQRTQQSFNQMKMAVVNFMGFNQVLNLTKNAIKNAINHIKELDSVMNKISIVTDMSTADLWNQVDAYSAMAQRYGTSIKGAYEVSQIYYQQGLETNDVLTLTNETLKLTRISGLDYAKATDYMTTALRGFKMEMSDAATVVDVYSNLAAHTAVSQEELAVAMSKTASSLQNVGATFEEASAMIATMVAVTRESATNIGSAMKSIASRYGELTKDPTKLIDADGEAMAFNKVDAALQSVGISMKTVDGQFREFTDVIVELGEKWDQLESTQQRYIATQFAGNRQQSRFLALVSNVDLLKANMRYAEESEDTGTIQALKALDSIEAKIEQVRVAYQQFYTTIGVESVWKGFLDGAKNVINTLNSFPKLFGKLPIGAIAAVANIVQIIKKFGITLISNFAQTFGKGIFQGMQSASSSAKAGANVLFNTINDTLKSNISKAQQTGSEIGQAVIRGATNNNLIGLSKSKQINYLNNKTVIERFGQEQDDAMAIAKANVLLQQGKITQEEFNQVELEGAAAAQRLSDAYAEKNTKLINTTQALASGFTNFGSALQMVSLLIDTSKPGMKTFSGTIMGLSGIIQAAGGIWQGFITSIQTGNSVLSSIPWTAVIMGAMALINGISTLIITPEEKLKELEDRAEELNNKAKEAKANYRTLDNSIKKLDELNEKRYESKEAAEEYQTAVDDLAEKFPELISGFDSAGNVIIDTTNVVDVLSEAYRKNAQAAYEAAKASAEVAQQQTTIDKNKASQAATNLVNDLFKVGSAEEANARTLLKEFNDALNSGDISQITESYNNFMAAANARGAKFTDNWSIGTFNTDINDLTNAMQSAFNSFNILTGKSKAVIGTWQQTQLNNKGQSYNYIKESDTASALVTNAISSDWADYEKVRGSSFEVNNENYRIIAKKNYIEQMDAFWNALNEDQQKLFDQMFSNTEDYTAEDFKDVFSKVKGFEDIQEMIVGYYADGIEAIQTRLNVSLANVLGKEADSAGNYENINYLDKSLTAFQREFAYAKEWNRTRGEESYLTSILNSYQDMREAGYEARAENFGLNAMELFKDVNSAPAEIEKQLWDLIKDNSLTTIEGIEKIKDSISNNTEYSKYIDTKWLDQLLDNIIPNINLAIQTATDQLLEGWEDTSKELNKAISGGLSIGEADKLISKAEALGLSLDIGKDFTQNGDKLILTSTAFKNYWDKLNEESINNSKKIQEKINEATKVLVKANRGKNLSEDDRAAIQAIAPSFDFTKYLDDTGKLTEEGQQELSDAIGLSQEGLKKYLEYNRIAAEQAKNAFNWALGDYSSYSSDIKKLKDLASGKTKLGKEEYNAKAVKENINKAYSSLISDVFTKGFTNINIDDYEGLIASDEAALKEALEAGDYTSFIEKYAAFAGYTIDEINQQVAKAIEKDEGLGKAKDAVDLISGGFNLEEFTNFLKKYNLGEIGQFFDNTGKAIGEFEGKFVTNEEGIIEIAEGKEQEVLDIFNNVLKANINGLGNLWKNLLENNLDKQIADLDKADVGKQASDSISKVASAKVGARINISKLPPEIQEKLDGNADGIYEVVSEFARDTALLAIDANSINDPEWKAQIREIQTNINSKRNKYTGLKGVLSSTFDRNTAETYFASLGIDTSGWADSVFNARMKAKGFEWDEYTQQFRATEEAITYANEKIEEAIKNEEAPEVIAELRQQAADLAQELTHDKKRDALFNLLSNYKDAESALSEFYAQFGAGFSKDELKQKGILTTDEHGKDVIDIDKLNEELNEVTNDYDDLFKDAIDQLTDEYITNAQKAGSLVTQGTTSMAEMTAFQQAYEELTGASIEFIYDPILQAWTFDAIHLRTYLEQAAKKTGLDKNGQEQWVEDQIKTLTVDNLDFSSYLSGDIGSKDNEVLKRNLVNYFETHTDGFSFLSAEELTEWAKSKADDTFAILSQGGQAAINQLKRIKGELTADEIEEAYRAQVAPLRSLADSIKDIGVNSIVSTNQIEALVKAGFEVNADGVVLTVGKLVDAYKSLYDDMKATGEATISELNSVMGQYLDSKDGEQAAIDALSKATGMTYSEFAEIYTQAGIELTEEMVNELESAGIIKGLGGNKMMIQDFKAFADSMHWDANSEEYTQAFKAYNDALIELDHKTENAIHEELSSIIDAKAGDRINVTQLQTALGLSNEAINTYLGELGGYIEDGILTVVNANDIPAIIAALAEEASKAGLVIPEKMAELQDAINGLLENITSIISKGIKGGLTTKDVQALESWSGLDLDTTRMKDGLKLSQKSAEELYEKLKQIDSISAQIVLDELNDSIEQSVTSAKELEGIMREVAEIRATTESDDFKFMSHNIPSGQNNPINYLENWSKAFKTMNEAGKAGGKMKNMMDYTDFYNIITEMGNLAQQTGEIKLSGNQVLTNCSDAAALIEEGAKALSVAADGSIKVDLSQLGIDFSTGASDLKANVGKGIQEVARSQVEMLDSMIQLLETIVAMEDLGNIDIDNDNVLEIGDIFPKLEYKENGEVSFEINQAYEDWRKDMLHKITEKIDGEDNKDFNKDLADAAKNLKIDGISFETILGWEPEDLAKQGKDFLGKYTAVMDAFWKAAQSGDYNLDNLIPSIKEVLAGTGYEGKIQIGDQTLVFSQGQILIQLEDGTYKGEHTNDSYPTAAAAAQAEALIKAGVEEGNIDKTNTDEQGNIKYKGTMKIDQTEFEVTLDENNKPVYTSEDGETFTSEFEAAQHAYEQYKDDKMQNYSAFETYAEWSVRVFGHLVSGTVEIENESEFQSRTHEQVQQLAQALANGNGEDIKVAAEKIGIKVELTNGEVLEEQRQKLAELTNIEDKTIVLDLVSDQAQSDAETLETTLNTLTTTEYSVNLDPSNIETALSKLQELKESLASEELTTTNTNNTQLDDNIETQRKKIKDLKAETESLSQTKVVPQVDTDKAENKLTHIKNLAKDALKEYKLKVKSDTTEANTQLTEIIQLLNNLNGIVNGIEISLKQDLMTNDQTKAQLDSINQLLMAIRSNPTAFITILANMDELREILGLIEILIERTIELKQIQPEINVSAPNAGAVFSQIIKLIAQLNVLGSLSPKPTVSLNDDVTGRISGIQAAINSITGKSVTIDVSYNDPGFSPRGGGGGGKGVSFNLPKATGNVGLSNAKGTLMGELGPELVVSNGRYFVAGQNGAEFVDLDTDAIVFNHLQTEQLLKHGMSKQRGQAVTNERNAVSFATGNVNGGPAMASAKAALAALRQLRAQWQAIAGMTSKDLAGLGGSGGGGGGGGNKQADPKAFVKQLEIWYNWLQRIAVLEEKINYEEAKRNEISSSFFPNGKEYVQSQKESLDYLKEQAAVQMSLVKSQQEYFEQRRAEMNSANNPFSALYTFDEYGQLKYKDGALEQLSQLIGRDSLTGQANMSAEEQYKRLVSMGYGKYMDYDSSGNPIDKEQDDWYVNAVQAFWDKIDSDKEEMQSLHDSIEEHKKALLEEEEKMNSILHEIEENQLNLEQKVLKGIEESRQREIDELQKQRDAIEESSQKLIDGLSEQLQKERDMYSNDESGKELTSLQRQLAILQRSGGSASQIASLQKEISQKQQDAYFEAQQAQIDALQEASDKQLEKLDEQINIMSEALEYEKLHGMLWEQVYEVLNGTPAEIAQFIKENTSDYWSQSAAQVAVNMREDLFEAEKFKAGIEYLGGINEAAEFYSKKAIEEEAAKKRKEEEEAKAKAAAAQTSQSSSGGSSSSSGSGEASAPNNPKDNDNNNNNKVSDVNGYSYSYTYGNQKRSDVINTSSPVVALAAAAKEITDATKRSQENSKGITGMMSTVSNYVKAVTSLKIDKITNGKKKASGGYVGHGIYELGEQGTETVLTAEQTQVLRDNILSNRPNSLISLLKSYNEGYDGINDNIKDVHEITDNSTIIEQATVEMHVSKIANDYDAQRAGEKALEKMISIARKTQAQNRVGR